MIFFSCERGEKWKKNLLFLLVFKNKNLSRCFGGKQVTSYSSLQVGISRVVAYAWVNKHEKVVYQKHLEVSSNFDWILRVSCTPLTGRIYDSVKTFNFLLSWIREKKYAAHKKKHKFNFKPHEFIFGIARLKKSECTFFFSSSRCCCFCANADLRVKKHIENLSLYIA